jgi:hypothetical protein
MILSLGQAVNTLLDPKEALDRVAEGDFTVTVHSLARIALTRRAVEDLRVQLGRLLEIEAKFQAEYPRNPGGKP